MLTAKRKRELDFDLWVIFPISGLVLLIYSVFNSSINKIIYDSSINIVLRVLFIGGIFQFGLAGLGITVVAVFRKESFLKYGLNTKNIMVTLLLSVGCCIPEFLYYFFTGNIHTWLPFTEVNTTAMVLECILIYYEWRMKWKYEF